jgi:enolase
MPIVSHLEALEILDSRGLPTLEVSCVLDGGIRGNAAVPTAGTPGRAEAVDLRDGEAARHRGAGRRKAVALIEGEIRAALVGKRFPDQATLDRALTTLDGTEKLSRLGGNTLIGISLAFARAHAHAQGAPLYRHFAEMVGKGPNRLPLPIVSLFARAAGDPVDRGPLALAVLPTAATTLDEALSLSSALAASAVEAARRRYDGGLAAAEDGALRAPFFDTDAVLDLAMQTIRGAEREPGRDVKLVLTAGASRRHDNGWYRIDREKLTPKEVIDHFAAWTAKYPVFAVEDPLAEEDWDGWATLCKRIGGHVRVVADDLLCTNQQRVKRALTQQSCNGLMIKPDQCGTLSEAAEALKLARKAGWTVVVAARAGETEDDWLSDLAVGWGAEHLQVGGYGRSERLAKYNRLLAIEKKTHWPLHRL